MNPTDYQRAAGRTECDQERARTRMAGLLHQQTGPVGNLLSPVRLNHAMLGMVGEAGELAAAVEKWIYYGQPLDVANVKEELGDVLWYVAQACNVLGLDMAEVMAANVRKLRARFPDRYTNEQAAEQGRDRTKERAALAPPACRHEWSTVPVDGVGDEVLRVCMICGERRRDEVATLRKKQQNCPHTWTVGTLAGSSVPARFCSVCNAVREYPMNPDGSMRKFEENPPPLPVNPAGFFGPFDPQETCPACAGVGWIALPGELLGAKKTCERCGGTGEVAKEYPRNLEGS